MKRAFSVWRRVRPSGVIAFLVLAATGCDTKTYQIDLRPHGDKIERHFTFSHRNKALEDPDRPEVVRIAKVYGARTPSLPAKQLSFTGMFSQTLPNDLGGDGHFVHLDSPLGCVRVYVERFRGNDDAQASLEVRRKAVDDIIDLLLGWFDSELHAVPDWPALRGFLDKTLRRDLQNLSLDAWAWSVGDISESKSLSAEVAFRAAQYLVERGYFAYEEMPALCRAWRDASDRGDSAALFTKIRRLLVDRAGRASDGRLTENLGFLSDSRRAYASWQHYFAQTAYYNQHKDEVRRRYKLTATPDSKPANSTAAASSYGISELLDMVLFDLAWTAFPLVGIHTFDEANRLELSLAAPREPFWSNGKWIAAERRIVWSKSIGVLMKAGDPPDWEWPRVCFATWDEPNDETQTRLLGTVLLTGENLLQYCLWYEGLSGQEKREWDAHFPSAKNDGRSFRSLYEFRFSNEPAAHTGNQRIAFPGADVLVNASTSSPQWPQFRQSP